MKITDEQMLAAAKESGAVEGEDTTVGLTKTTCFSDPELRTFVEIIEKMIVPEGYVVVPLKPTQEMLEVGWQAYRDSDKPAPFNMMSDGFKAMLAASKKGE